MKKIGRRSYFDKLTGELLAEVGEREGNVIETTIEEDFSIYDGLKNKTTNDIEIINFNYGDNKEELKSCCSYKIDLKTKKLNFITEA